MNKCLLPPKPEIKMEISDQSIIPLDILICGGFTQSLWDGFDLNQERTLSKINEIKEFIIKAINDGKWEQVKKQLIETPVHIHDTFFHLLAALEDHDEFKLIFDELFDKDRQISEDIAESLNFFEDNILQIAIMSNIQSALTIWKASTNNARIKFNNVDHNGNLIFYLFHSLVNLIYDTNGEPVNIDNYVTLLNYMVACGYDLNHKNNQGHGLTEYISNYIHELYEEDQVEPPDDLSPLNNLIDIYLKLVDQNHNISNLPNHCHSIDDT